MLNDAVVSVGFSVMTSDDIRNYSVMRVENENIWDETLNEPVVGGLLDLRMGPAMMKSGPCQTCGGKFVSETIESYANDSNLQESTCIGHFGHIVLPAPVYLPIYVDTLYDVISAFCHVCGHSLVQGVRRRRTFALAKREHCMTGIMRLLRENAVDKCAICKTKRVKITSRRGSGGVQAGYSCETSEWFPLSILCPDTDNMLPLTGARARCIIDNILKNNQVIDALIADTGCCNLPRARVCDFFDSLIHDVIVVMPPCARVTLSDPHNKNGVLLNEFTYKYLRVLTAATKLAEFMRRVDLSQAGGSAMLEGKLLQTSVDIRHAETLYAAMHFHIDTIIVKTSTQRAPEGVSMRHVKHTMGIVQNLKGKSGRFRANLMGKRVNFSARTVITPDPNIPFDSMAIPRSVAAVLTVHERVTPLNRERLERSASNELEFDVSGRSTRSLFDEHGHNQVNLYIKPYNVIKTGRLRVGMIVERPLQDGDIVLLDRQPTLHGPSMQAVRVVVQSRSTFAFGLSKTTPFNADFDGDEVFRLFLFCVCVCVCVCVRVRVCNNIF